MANNRIQVKRTSTTGRTPNTTNVANGQYIQAGELALNMADGILYTSNGSTLIEVGANNTNVRVTGTLTVNSISANGSLGTSGQVLASNGSTVYWSTGSGSGTVTSVGSGDGLTGGPITTNGSISVLANNGLLANATGLYVVPGNGLVAANSTGVHVGPGNGIVVNSTAVAVRANTGLIANAVGLHINATYIATLSSNNATFLNSLSSNNYTQRYSIPNTLASTGWIRLGTLATAQDGRHLIIRIVASAGYNASIAQNAETVIRFKTSNGGSNTAGFLGDGYAYRSGNITAPSTITVVQLSSTSYEFWANFAAYTGEGAFYEVACNGSTWTHSGTNNGTTAPTGTTTDLTIYTPIHSGLANNGLSANATGIYVVPGNGLVTANATGVHVGAGLGVSVNSTAVSVLANTGIIANATGIYVNAAYINTISSNSATFANSSVTNTFTVGTAAYFIANGNLGIGTSSPGTRLDVRRTDSQTGYTEVATIAQQVDATNNSIMMFGQISDNKMFIETRDESNTKGVLTLQPYGGRVGVGSVGDDFGRDWNLVVRRDQNAVTQFGVINTTVGASAAAQITKIGGTGNSFLDWGLADNSGSPYDVYSYGSAVTSVRWAFGTSERMRLTSGGNLGVGTTNPGNRLTVVSSGDIARFEGNTSSAAVIINQSDAYGVNTERPILSLRKGNVSGFNLSMDGGTQGAIYYEATGNNSLQAFFTNGSERLRITNTGNVGIGNASPNARLQVTGTANVSGNVAIAGITTFSANIVLGSSGLSANGSFGSNGQVLTSNGSATYWANSSAGATSSITRQTFTGNGITTSFTITGGYTPNQIDVYVNGVKVLNGTDVTVSSGTAIVFASPPPSGAVIEATALTVSTVTTNEEIGGYYKGGSATVGSPSNANNIFRVNGQTLYNDTFINADENASCAGPIVVASGKVLSVAAGGRIVIV